MVGCDLHDKTMLLQTDVDGKVQSKEWANNPRSRKEMIADLWRKAAAVGVKRIVFAYEASGLGFVLHDELRAAGIECYVLAPTGIERSIKHWRRKTDQRDAQRLLDILRAHLLAGNKLPSVWIPDRQTRDDRELTRARLEVGEKITLVKTQIRCLLKRNGVEWHEAPVKGWTSGYKTFLESLRNGRLMSGAWSALASLMRQLGALEQEMETLDQEVRELSLAPRYAPVVAAMRRDKGVGVLTAMVLATELGDLDRFKNRRQLGSFLGLTPSSQESGQKDDCKGHITHQGPSRVRKVLNQAVWSRIRCEPSEAAFYERLAKRNPNHKKIAVVAAMRRMGIRCWHNGLEAQRALRVAGVADAPPCPVAPATATTTANDVVQRKRRVCVREFYANAKDTP
jgi:transposase